MATKRADEASKPTIKKFSFTIPKYAPLDYLMFGTLAGLFILSLFESVLGIGIFAFILGLLLGNKFSPAKPEMTEVQDTAQVIDLEEPK